MRGYQRVFFMLFSLFALLTNTYAVKGAGNPFSAGEVAPGSCVDLDIVFILGDTESARAVEVLLSSLAFFQETYCHEFTLQVAVIDALSFPVKVLRVLSPLSLPSDEQEQALLVPLQNRPRYRAQWLSAFDQALDLLRWAQVAHRKQVIFYMGGVAQDASTAYAKQFIGSEFLSYLSGRLSSQQVSLWVLNGEGDREFQEQIVPLWQDAYQKGILRGDFLPVQGSVQTAQGYIRLVVKALQELGVGMYMQEIGCGAYGMPVLSSLFIGWLRIGQKTAQWPQVNLKFQDGTVQEVKGPILYVFRPPVGGFEITSSRCDVLVGFVQVEHPHLRVRAPRSLFQDRGQPAPDYRFEAVLVDHRGDPLPLAEPLPQIKAVVFEKGENNAENKPIVTLDFVATEEGYLISEALPRKRPGSYLWEVSGTLPYFGIQTGEFRITSWPLEKQRGEYEVVPVERMTLHVRIEGWEEGTPLPLHGPVQAGLPVLPVVVQAWVTDEAGKVRLPSHLFADPERAFKLRLVALEQNQESEIIWMKPERDSWYGKIGHTLSGEGQYLLEVEKSPLKQPTLIWDTDEVWRQRIIRQDPFWRKPAVWKGMGLLSIMLLLMIGGIKIYDRTHPLNGFLDFKIEDLPGSWLTVSLRAYQRGKVRLNPEELGPEGVGIPVLVIRRHKDGVKIRTETGLIILLKPGETKPLLEGLDVTYRLEEEDE